MYQSDVQRPQRILKAALQVTERDQSRHVNAQFDDYLGDLGPNAYQDRVTPHQRSRTCRLDQVLCNSRIDNWHAGDIDQ